MMIGTRGRTGKAAANPFRSPPWTYTAPERLALDAQLEPDHLARLIERGVERLDLTPLHQTYAGRGSKAWPPALMLKIVLFEIQRGRTSPAQWYRDTKENIALHWLGLGIRPSRSVWYEFAWRVRHYLDDWNRQVLHLAQEHGLTSARRGALDGTAVEANASRHHLLNQEQLQQRRPVLDAAIQADAAGTEPPAAPYWLAKTAGTRQRQQAQYATAAAKLAERLADNRQRMPSKRLEEKNVRISVTDPDAVLGRDKHYVFRPLYNVQLVRDVDSPFLLAYDTFAHSSDAGTLKPMLQRTQELTGRPLDTALVDSGYVSAVDLADAQEANVDLYGPWKENDYSAATAQPPKQLSKDVFTWDDQAREYRCPQRQPLPLVGVQNRTRSRQRTEKLEIYRAAAATCAACPQKAQCCPKARSGRSLSRSEHEALIEAHRQKMATTAAKEVYKLRRQTVEPSFGDVKEHRNFRRVNGRGLWKAKIHTALTVLASNVLGFVKGLLGTEPQESKT
jgi:transposase